uniref:Amidase domain-containing protein n=1 Tax=Caenorhabditis japonica TaxID=281687 RepID=A0A8R1I2E7_CAEJA
MEVPRRLKKAFHTSLIFIANLYFSTIRFIFWFINYFFRERVYVTPPTDQLLLISATQAVRMISKREISSTALVESYIHRIEQVNNTINAVVVKLFDSARREANEVDSFIAVSDEEDIQRKLVEQPLFGVPFTMKDALEVENEIITCGVYNRRDTKCDRTAEAIKRLQAAGGILLAVTNVPEVCMWVEAINTVYGRSKNPYDARRMTGGSSGGEGALLGAAGSVVGVGSDIGGSIRMPSFFNGIFGLKPTPGVIPLEGHIPEPTGYKTNMLRIGP